MIYANKQHLLGMDEMQRYIQHEAMALTLGVGLVLGMSYELLEDIKLISFEYGIKSLPSKKCLSSNWCKIGIPNFLTHLTNS